MRVMASSLGKMPTTLVRRLISAWSRSIGLVGEGVVFGLVNEGGEFGHVVPKLAGAPRCLSIGIRRNIPWKLPQKEAGPTSATVHWVLVRDSPASRDDLVALTYAWSDGKKRFSPRQIALAADVLTDKGWADDRLFALRP